MVLNMPKNELVLITGASGGIGLNLTRCLLEANWRNLVFQYRRDSHELDKVLRKFGLNPKDRVFQAELTDEEEVRQLRERIHDSFGPVYGLLNLAGGSSNKVTWKLSKSEFQSVMDMNLLTTFLCCREFAPGMRELARGRIINISSVVAFSGVAGAAHYCAAKAAIVGFSKALALELAPKNIAVSTIALGYFQYGIINSIPPDLQERIKTTIPATRFGHATELSGMVDYLLGKSGAYSSGQVYHLNGGLYS